jgi:cyanate permease
MISVGAPKLIAQWFTGAERGAAMGIYMTGPGLGGILALSLTNSVVMPALGEDWRAVLTLYAGVTLAAGAIWLVIARHPQIRPRIGAVAMGSKKAGLSAFLDILRLPTVQLVLAMSIGIFFFNHGLNNWLPEILRTRGLTAAEAGYWAALPTAVGLIGSLIIPRFATAERRRAILCALFVAALVASLLLQLDPGLGLATGLILQGVARSSMMTVAILLLLEAPGVPAERAGLAGGMFFTFAEIGGVLGPLTVGVLSETSGGFVAPLGAMTVMCLMLLTLLGVLSLAVRRAPPNP